MVGSPRVRVRVGSGASINQGSCRRIREMARLADGPQMVMKPGFIATWFVAPNEGMGGISPSRRWNAVTTTACGNRSFSWALACLCNSSFSPAIDRWSEGRFNCLPVPGRHAGSPAAGRR